MLASFAVTRFAVLSLVVLVGCGPSLREVHQGDVFYERCYAAEHDRSVGDSERQECWAAWLAEYQLGQPAARVRHAEGRVAGLERGEAVRGLPGIGESPAEAARRRAETASEDRSSRGTVPPTPIAAEASEGSDDTETTETTETTENSGSQDTPDENGSAANGAEEPDASGSEDSSREAVSSPNDESPEPDTSEASDTDQPRDSSRHRSPPVITSHNRSCEPGCLPRWQACADRCDEGPCYQSCDAEYRVCMRACIF